MSITPTFVYMSLQATLQSTMLELARVLHSANEDANEARAVVLNARFCLVDFDNYYTETKFTDVIEEINDILCRCTEQRLKVMGIHNFVTVNGWAHSTVIRLNGCIESLRLCLSDTLERCRRKRNEETKRKVLLLSKWRNQLPPECLGNIYGMLAEK